MKQPLDINPLLPAFVRAPHNTGNSTAPFVGGSVDLSLGSSVRNTSAQSSSGSSNNNQTQSSKNRQNPSSAPASNKHAATSSFLGGSDTTPFGSWYVRSTTILVYNVHLNTPHISFSFSLNYLPFCSSRSLSVVLCKGLGIKAPQQTQI